MPAAPTGPVLGNIIKNQSPANPENLPTKLPSTQQLVTLQVVWSAIWPFILSLSSLGTDGTRAGQSFPA